VSLSTVAILTWKIEAKTQLVLLVRMRLILAGGTGSVPVRFQHHIVSESPRLYGKFFAFDKYTGASE
jgi:hypothetical protein